LLKLLAKLRVAARRRSTSAKSAERSERQWIVDYRRDDRTLQ
jgi:hypothetical protein